MARLKKSSTHPCKHCQSADTVAYGKVRDKQRYYCNKCKRTFGENKKKVVDMKTAKRHAILFYTGEVEGRPAAKTCREIALYLNVNRTYVARWLKEYKAQEEERRRRRESGRPNRQY